LKKEKQLGIQKKKKKLKK